MVKPFLLIGIWTVITMGAAVVSGKELPVLVEIRELPSHNGERVVIEGSVVSVVGRIGRRGSQYVELVVDQDGAIVSVMADFLPKAKRGDGVIVQGTYRNLGWFGGYPEENMIVAELIEGARKQQ